MEGWKLMTVHLHPSTDLGKVKLKVSNLQRSIKFYQEIIGFKILTHKDNIAELTADGVHPLLILEELPNAVTPRERTTTGLYHFAILVPNREQLGLSLRQLIKSGIHIGQSDHAVSEALYISDPDQNGIEIYADRPRESWRKDAEGNVMMSLDPIDWDGLLEVSRDLIWTGLPSDTVIGHVHLHVADLEKAKAFYVDLLGFDMMVNGAERMGALFVSAGGYHHHLGLNIWAGKGAPQPPQHATGLAYYTIVLPDQSELITVVDRLRTAGVVVQQEAIGWSVQDPFGITIRFVAKA
jgi:catechol 2,3-dioxygenase